MPDNAAGWNDAAWGQSPRHVNADLVGAYARGYAGGLVYRQRLANARFADCALGFGVLRR